MAITGLVTAYLGILILIAKIVAIAVFGAALVLGTDKALDQIPEFGIESVEREH